jgi:hypothetical protein
MVRDILNDAHLVPDGCGDDDHERQAHDQPRCFDGGVQLVAGQEFEVGLHIIVVPDLTGNPFLVNFVTILNCASDMSDEIVLIQNLIYEIRGQKVMLDSDLAKLYQVDTKVLNQAVKK